MSPGSAQTPGNEDREEGEATAGDLLQSWDKTGALELEDRGRVRIMDRPLASGAAGSPGSAILEPQL